VVAVSLVLIRKVEVLNQLDEVVVESTLISLMRRRLNREGEPE
jgi:hypothetical protein